MKMCETGLALCWVGVCQDGFSCPSLMPPIGRKDLFILLALCTTSKLLFCSLCSTLIYIFYLLSPFAQIYLQYVIFIHKWIYSTTDYTMLWLFIFSGHLVSVNQNRERGRLWCDKATALSCDTPTPWYVNTKNQWLKLSPCHLLIVYPKCPFRSTTNSLPAYPRWRQTTQQLSRSAEGLNLQCS